MSQSTEITIGNFSIRKCANPDGKPGIFLVHDSGNGVGMLESELSDLLENYFFDDLFDGEK